MAGLRGKYLLVGAALAAFAAALAYVMAHAPAAVNSPSSLIAPMAALVGLTAIVWSLMVVYRNLAFIRGLASERYYQAYTVEAPPEWVERPARTYMNLLELPLLFYVACLLMIATGKLDGLQVSLAWLFVASRYVHAVVYIGFNYVPLRFAAFASGAITLGILWARLVAL